MKVGVLKEIKTKENRVAMTPAGVEQMIAHGHTVMVETTAGEGSGFFINGKYNKNDLMRGVCNDF